MSANKKPRSKPAAKKKAVRILAPFTPGPDSQLIASIAVRVAELQSELKRANQKLDYCVTVLDDRLDQKEEPHPVVAEAIKAMEGDGEGNQQ
jgi:vacuolar-type H+-ATPase subunit I/STV1